MRRYIVSLRISILVGTLAIFFCQPFVSRLPAASPENTAPAGELRISISDGGIAIESRNCEIATVLAELSRQTETPIIIGGEITGRVTVNIAAANIAAALAALCAGNAILYEYLPERGEYRILKALATGTMENEAIGNPVTPVSPPEKTDRGKAVPLFLPTATAAGRNAAGKEAAPDTTSAGSIPAQRPTFKKGELLVWFSPEVSAAQKEVLHTALGSVVIRRIDSLRIDRVRLAEGLPEEEALQRYRQAKIVERASRNALRYPQTTPNDPGFDSQWGLTQINAPALWDLARGNRAIVVAVIDSGIDYTHPDLQGNIWINETERDGEEGVDDDRNGKIDDVFGWDFTGLTDSDGDGFPDGDNDPMDSYGHGTHVAGIIGATGNNALGVSGVNWQVRLMPLKVMKDGDIDFTEDAILEALAYALANGAHVVNCSFGGVVEDEDEKTAFAALREKGILAVVAAGNYGDDMELGNKLYPACYELDNIISVAWSDSTDKLDASSNYGRTSVDVAAPGSNIYSTVPATGTDASVMAGSETYPALGILFAGQTAEEGIPGTLVDCKMGYPDEIPDTISGSIALVERGNRDGVAFYFWQKAENVQARGATGIIFRNNIYPEDDPEDSFDEYGGTFATPGDWVPAVSITKASGEELFKLTQTESAPPTINLVNKPSTNAYGYKYGTSMAAPHVAGLAALLYGQCPTSGYGDIKSAIINSSDKITALADKTVSGGRINAFAARTALTPPGDLSGDCRIDLADAIIALRIISGEAPSFVCPLSACNFDVNADGLISLAEPIHILQQLAELR